MYLFLLLEGPLGQTAVAPKAKMPRVEFPAADPLYAI